MVRTISDETIAALKSFSTCIVANAIEYFDVRLRNEGFGDSSIHCRFPHLPPMVGYAATLRLHGSSPPMEGGAHANRTDWLERIEHEPAPRILVIEDADRPPGEGAYVGETHAAILQAIGCVGVVTNGAVRDLPEVESLGFHLFSSNVSVPHAYAHVAQVETPVRVAGLNIAPGDLLHGDQHGIVKIPPSIADRIPPVAARLKKREEEITKFCQSDRFSREQLRQILKKPL